MNNKKLSELIIDVLEFLVFLGIALLISWHFRDKGIFPAVLFMCSVFTLPKLIKILNYFVKPKQPMKKELVLNKVLLTDFYPYKDMDLSFLPEIFLKLKKAAETKTLLGEVDPDYMTISLKNVSHLIENIELIDNKIYGKVTIVDTPRGNVCYDMLNILKNEAEILFQARTFKENNILKDIITFDIKEIKTKTK